MIDTSTATPTHESAVDEPRPHDDAHDHQRDVEEPGDPAPTAAGSDLEGRDGHLAIAEDRVVAGEDVVHVVEEDGGPAGWGAEGSTARCARGTTSCFLHRPVASHVRRKCRASASPTVSESSIACRAIQSSLSVTLPRAGRWLTPSAPPQPLHDEPPKDRIDLLRRELGPAVQPPSQHRHERTGHELSG
jgi:hypothetical protein